MIWLTLKPNESFFVYLYKVKKNSFTEKELFKEKGEWRIEQKAKEDFSIALVTAMKKAHLWIWSP